MAQSWQALAEKAQQIEALAVDAQAVKPNHQKAEER
jgi:hypothetical protein